MRTRLGAAGAVAFLLLAAGGVGTASAHNISGGPSVGDAGTIFRYKGTGWQPGRRTTAQYYFSEGDAAPSRTFSGRANRRGRFSFTFKPRQTSLVGVESLLCFRQFDTRFGRTFRRCTGFFLEPPRAWFAPAETNPGSTLFLYVRGFFPGSDIEATLTRPSGTTESYLLLAATRSRLVSFSPFGRLLVSRGGTIKRFNSGTGDELGTYTIALQSPGGLTARAAVRLETP